MFTFCSSPRTPMTSRFAACCAGHAHPGMIAVRPRHQADGEGAYEGSQNRARGNFSLSYSHLYTLLAGGLYAVGNLCSPLLRLPKEAAVDANFRCEGHRLHVCGRCQPARWMRNSHPWFSMRNGGGKRREGAKFVWLYSNYRSVWTQEKQGCPTLEGARSPEPGHAGDVQDAHAVDRYGTCVLFSIPSTISGDMTIQRPLPPARRGTGHERWR